MDGYARIWSGATQQSFTVKRGWLGRICVDANQVQQHPDGVSRVTVKWGAKPWCKTSCKASRNAKVEVIPPLNNRQDFLAARVERKQPKYSVSMLFSRIFSGAKIFDKKWDILVWLLMAVGGPRYCDPQSNWIWDNSGGQRKKRLHTDLTS